MKKIILILLALTSFTLANDYYFVVENSTMVDAYFNVFNAISSILNSNDYISVLRFVFLLGGFFMFVNIIAKSSESANTTTFMPYLKYSIFGTILLAMLFSSNAKMWVETKHLPSFCATTSTNTGFAVELPETLAFVFSSINKIGRELTSLSESAFYPPNAMGTPSMTDNEGYLGALKSAKLLLNMKVNDTITSNPDDLVQFDFEQVWASFFSKCVYEVLQNKGAIAAKELLEMKTSKNLEIWIENFLNKSFTSNYPVKDNLIAVNGEHTTCGAYHAGLIKPSFAKFKENLACALPTLNAGTLELINKANNNQLSNLQEMAIQSGLINAVDKSLHYTKIGITGADYATGKTKAETNAQNLGAASYMAEMLPYLQMTIRAILYAFFPFVFITILLPGGFRVLTQYSQTLLWVELWSPTAAIVNMFVNLQVQNSIGNDFNERGLTVITSLNMLSEANTIAGVGAMLYLSIPALTWLILKGSAQMLGSLTSGIGANFAKNLETKAQAQDFAAKELSEKTGKNITEKEKLEAQKQAISSYSEAIAFENAGALNYYNTAQKMSDGTYANNISKVNNQDYVYNQRKLGEQEAGATSGKIEAFVQNGGIKAEEKLQYTNADLNYKENKKLTDTFSNEQIASSNFENKKENITKTLETKENFENKFGDTANAYTIEATQKAEERKADIRKIDMNDNGNISKNEQNAYSKDVTTKAISDQNSLKATNERLEKSADMFANSKNDDIKDTYNKNLKTYGSKEAAAAATLASLQTKESSYNIEEKSQYLDTLNSSNVDMNKKGEQQALQDVKSINKNEENIKQHRDFMSDLNKNKYTEKRDEILGKLGEELLNEAHKNGAISNQEKSLYKDKEVRLKNINEIEKRIGTENEKWSDSYSLKNEYENLEKINSKINETDLKVANFSNNKTKEITAKYREQLDKIKEGYKKDFSNESDVKIQETAGKNEGRKVDTIGADGREYTQIKDVEGNKITFTSKSQRGYENIGRFAFDATYYASEKTESNYDKEIAITKSVVKSTPILNKIF